MQSPAVVVSAFLFSCGVIYVFIWTKIPGKLLSFHEENILANQFNLFWRSGNERIGASEHHVTLDTSEHKHQINITPIPILYKKNFTKMPKWDFEDVYMQSSETQRQVCSNSLQKSKVEEFQQALMQNIQLWFHKELLSMSEWNRLAHFNNPFGFMEYNYTEIKKSVDLIQKPKYNQILPVPRGSADGCIRCAVVGTGGILDGSRMGKEIDSHDYVFRMNGAMTKGFEDDVGNKTSVYVHTSFSITQSIIRLKEYGLEHIPQDEGIKYVMIPEGLKDYEWLEGLLKKKMITYGSFLGYRPFTYYGDRFQEDTFYVLHPDFLRYVRNRFLLSKKLENRSWAKYRPTNGAFTVFLALHTCDIVDVYGFMTAEPSKYSNYYYEKATKTRYKFVTTHDYDLEKDTWKKLHGAGIIRLYQRQ